MKQHNTTGPINVSGNNNITINQNNKASQPATANAFAQRPGR